jgi:hypothetical protein
VKKERAVVVLAALGLLAGCSGDEKDQGGVARTETAAKPKVDPRPRVEGRWRIVYTPLSGEQEQRATWIVSPDCPEGPCGFRIKSDQGARHRFVYDEAIKDWTGRDRQRNPCVTSSGDVLVKDAYRVQSQITLTPMKAVKTFVTELFGERRDRVSLTPKAESAECDPAPPTQDSIRAVRADPPPGKPKTVGDGVGYDE